MKRYDKNSVARSLLSLTALAVLAGAALLAAPGFARAQGMDCLTCHGSDPAVESFTHSIHGRYFADRGAAGCQSCHGASLDHLQNPRQNPVEMPFGEDAAGGDANAACLGCHDGGEQKGWHGSQHAMADLACDSCHSIHTPRDPVSENLAQADICLSCHTHLKASHRKFSRHPIAEGVMGCASCHQPHGGKGPAMLVEATVNETCFLCHTEKRGPVLFEHEPVQDNCLNCHTPHGSVHDNMLVSRQPLLCQQCHIAARHPGTNYVNEESWGNRDNRLIGKSCVNCHTQVHGSNHPAGFSFRR